jgi:hypothetical protein
VHISDDYVERSRHLKREQSQLVRMVT